MSAHRRVPLNVASERQHTPWSRLRLLGLFFLFDALLIVAILLSFQGTELVQEEVTLIQTREVFEIQIRDQVITNTMTVTRVMPYGWTP